MNEQRINFAALGKSERDAWFLNKFMEPSIIDKLDPGWRDRIPKRSRWWRVRMSVRRFFRRLFVVECECGEERARFRW